MSTLADAPMAPTDERLQLLTEAVMAILALAIIGGTLYWAGVAFGIRGDEVSTQQSDDLIAGLAGLTGVARPRSRGSPSGARGITGEGVDAAAAPITICLLGGFRVLKRGTPVSLRQGGKGEQLLGQLALRSPDGIPRAALLADLWPEREADLAGQSLNTLVYSLRRLLGDALQGGPPVLFHAGRYALNANAGVEVDVTAFDAAARDGDRLSGSGDQAGPLSPIEEPWPCMRATSHSATIGRAGRA